MIRGLYTSASGMLAMETQNELIAQNVANVNTPGYKELEGSPTSFEALLMNRVSNLSGDIKESTPIGGMGTGVYIGEVSEINREAELVPGDSTDFALTTPGYFVIETPEGLQYTRRGEFRLTDDGALVTWDGNPVMGLYGPIIGLTRDFTVQANGTLEVDGEFVDSFLIVDIPLENLRQVGDALYEIDGQVEPEVVDQFTVRQGVLEGSNVEITSQMTKMIAALRAYEANQKVIQTQDSTLDKAVNEIGKLY